MADSCKISIQLIRQKIVMRPEVRKTAEEENMKRNEEGSQVDV